MKARKTEERIPVFKTFTNNYRGAAYDHVQERTKHLRIPDHRPLGVKTKFICESRKAGHIESIGKHSVNVFEEMEE